MPAGDPARPLRRGTRASPRLPRLVIAGAAGRLGRAVVADALAQGFPIAAAIDQVPSRGSEVAPGVRIEPPARLIHVLDRADVYLTATTPAAERANLPIVARSKVAAVVATTGLGSPRPRWLDACARRVPIVQDSNFSLGMAILRSAVRSLGPLPDGFDVSIVEAHRREKADHPSGTARSIANDLVSAGIRSWHPAGGRRSPGQVEIASLRGGETPGVHVVQIAGPSELLRFEHLAYGRACFADGMLTAARWLSANRSKISPGYYSVDDVRRGGLP